MYKNKAKLYVEGIADKRFLEEYLEFLYHIRPDKNDVTELKGWTNLGREAAINDLQKNTANGGLNLVILDADNNPLIRRAEIEDIKQTNGLHFELFLLPDDSSPGALEDLLISAMNPINQSVCGCWARYEWDLLQQTIPWKKPPTPTIPAKKTRIYAYLEALVGEAREQKKLIKEAERKYMDPNHWDLSAKGLIMLKTFLDKYLK